MPKVSSLPRLSRNVYAYARATLDFWRARPFLEELATQARERFDVVHFNHEALFLVAAWLRVRSRRPHVMHIRTNLHPTWFARWQQRVIGRVVDHRVFITANEEVSYRRLGGQGAGTVIFNIVDSPQIVTAHPEIPDDGRFRIACLSNYSWYRGTDRLIEVAEALRRRGRTDVLFVLAGRNDLSRGLPGELGQIAAAGGTLVDYANRRGVANYFLFLGHVSEPGRVIASCDALAKPTREDNPWGRDILEAAAQGRVIFSIGRDDTFVRDGQTGVLFAAFDAEAFADRILALADDREARRSFGGAARELVLKLCDGPGRAMDLLRVWSNVRRIPA
jgi:glycosyltransferase involved in cell wall biosynthesis